MRGSFFAIKKGSLRSLRKYGCYTNALYSSIIIFLVADQVAVPSSDDESPATG
jgi:hypothetical protein